ncbi:MAG: cysteine hydrolase [Anaerolineae bacterium]|nr:cysteine hydrolase [Anaerolineae bacterium]
MPGLLQLNGRYRSEGRERSEMLRLPAARTALLLVDVYYNDQERGDWGDPADPFVAHFQRLEDCIALSLEVARQAGLSVLYAMNSAPRIALERSAFGAHFARSWSTDGVPDAFIRAFAEGGVDNREYCGGRNGPLKVPPRLAPREGEPYIRKHVYSAFFDSRLDTALRNLGVSALVCAGLWANVCMAATALDALYRNYTVIWLRDGTLAGESGEGVVTLDNTARWIAWFEEVIGYTVTSAEFALACSAAGSQA